MEYYTFEELRTEFSEIERWLVFLVQSKTPRVNIVNVYKSIDKINENWNRRIVCKTPESWEDFKHPKFAVTNK